MLDALKKLFLVLIAQLPLLGVGLTLPQAKDHPVGAALVAVLYEALVFGGGFVLKVWNEELEKDAIKATAGWARVAMRGFAPGFRRRYCQRVIRDHGVFNVKGLGLINTFTLSLRDVFVDSCAWALPIVSSSGLRPSLAPPAVERRLCSSRWH